MFEIRRYTPALANEWNQFVAASKNGTFLFDRRYMDYHADRFQDHSLLFYLGERLLAVLPAHQSGDTLCSHNGLTYGGLVMSPRLTVVQTMNLFRELNDYLRGEGFRHVSYKCIPWIYHRLPAEEDLYALITNMTKTRSTQIVVQFTKQIHGLNHRQTRAHHQTAISETIVRAERIARLMGWQNGQQAFT